MFTISPLLYTLPALALIVSSSGAQIPPVTRRDDTQRQVFTSAVSASIESALQARGIHGLTATAVFANDSTNPQFATYGNRTEDGDAVDKETLFFIGSCSKAFLAGAMGILMDDFASGKNTTALPDGLKSFTWETKVHDLIGNGSEWKLPDQFSTERTNVRDLLSHVVGLPGHDLAYRITDDVPALINRLQYLKQNRELRQEWQYSNPMYIVGSHVIATYAGKPFTEFVQERILTPLNMTSAFYFASRVPSELNISQSFTAQRRTPLWSTDDRLAEFIAGPGGLLTNPVDMSKWLAMMLNRGVNPTDNQTIISEGAFDAITISSVIEAGKASLPELSVVGYGMGWERYTYRGHEIVFHTGGVTGFTSFTAFFPFDGVAVHAALNDGQALDVLVATAFAIFDSALGLSPLETSTAPASSGNSTSTSASISARADSNVTVDLTAYAGTYTDPGYGNITFCAPDSTFGDCPQVLATFSTIIPNLNSTPGLYANWDRFWTRQAMLVPVSGNQWDFSTATIYPEGFGKDTTPFTDSIYVTPFPALFDTEGETVKGFGMFGGFIGATLEDEADASIPVKDRAEVYFTKQ